MDGKKNSRKEMRILTYWFEKDAKNNAPMPDGVTAEEAQMYSFLRNLYWSLDHKIISAEQAQREKNIMEKLIDKGKKGREFERKCWENSAKRTMAAERGMTMYRKNRTLENADIMYDRLEWLHDECSISVKKSEHGANCPICGAFFNQDHAFRKPQYCEDCGCHLKWEAEENG